MPAFLSAHGFDPGPTQRPWLAGALSGIAGSLPAVALLAVFGSLEVEAQILGTSELMTIAAGVPLMALAGTIYARLFGRAANDAHGGWLFGMAFGFALWAAGAVMILPIVSGGDMPAGIPAAGLFLSLVVWGAALGIVHPLIHRPLHESLEAAAQRAEVGANAASSRQGH